MYKISRTQSLHVDSHLLSPYIHTNSQTVKKTCIDNILTNSSDCVEYSGTIDNGMKHHKPVFQISSIKTSEKVKEKLKTTIFYDYSNNHVDNLCYYLERNKNTMHAYSESFAEFNEFYQFAIDKTCKLEKPKTTKRTSIVNPGLHRASYTQ